MTRRGVPPLSCGDGACRDNAGGARLHGLLRRSSGSDGKNSSRWAVLLAVAIVLASLCVCVRIASGDSVDFSCSASGREASIRVASWMQQQVAGVRLTANDECSDSSGQKVSLTSIELPVGVTFQDLHSRIDNQVTCTEEKINDFGGVSLTCNDPAGQVPRFRLTYERSDSLYYLPLA